VKATIVMPHTKIKTASNTVKAMNKKMIPLILASVLCSMVHVQAQSVDRSLLSSGLYFLDIPYVAHTLEVNGNNEQLVINTDQMDCTTFVEYSIAMSLAKRAEDTGVDERDFFNKVQQLRYRNGKIDGYTSRLHYVTDWINNAIEHGYLEDVTAEHAPYTQVVNLSYMTAHPDQYPQLADSPDNVAKMKQIEQSLSGKSYHFLPKAEVSDFGLPWIKEGDIIIITTDIPGLDATHMGIADYVKSKLSLLHASSREKKVALSGVTLAELLKENRRSTGIRVLRIKAGNAVE
jgi:hypothetical protein